MFRSSLWLLLAALPLSAQAVFQSRWVGTDVAPYATNPGYCIHGFDVAGPDAQGYVSLLARSSEGGTTPVFRSRWTGTAVQAFNGSGCIVAFQVSGPDAMGYVTLTAVDANGGSGAILRTRWAGTAVQPYTLPSGSVLDAFFIGGPDAMGYVVLSADTVDAGTPVEENDPTAPTYPFALQRIQLKPGGTLVLHYSLPQSGPVRLTLFNAMGQKIATLIDGEQPAGRHQVSLRTPTLARGIYFLNLSTPGQHLIRKLVLAD